MFFSELVRVNKVSDRLVSQKETGLNVYYVPVRIGFASQT